MTVYDMSGSPATWQPGVMKMTYFGCPWHGVLKNGELYADDFTTHKKSLPNWTQVASSRVNSATQLVRVPGMPAISRTSEQQTWDAAQGFDWKNYALVGGYHLYGKALHSNWIIYIDGNSVPWMLDMYLSAGGAGFYCNVYLRRIFGRISEASYPVINATLDTYSDATMQTLSGGIYRYSGPECIERNSTGSTTYINVYAYKTSNKTDPLDDGFIDYGNNSADGYKAKVGQLLAVYKVVISGNGSVDPGTLGDGITATVSQHKVGADCYSTGSRVVDQNESVYVNINAIDSYTTEDLDTRTGPPCPATYVDTYTTYPQVHPTTYSDVTENYQTRLIRCLFDANDNAVEYSAEYVDFVKKQVRSVDLSGSMLRVDTITVEEQGEACVETGTSQDLSGSLQRVVDETTVTQKIMRLYRNGTEVVSADLTNTNQQQHTDTHDWGGYTQGSTSFTSTDTCNGVALPYSTDLYRPLVHPYSPQVFGVILRDSVSQPSYCRLEAVMTPWGIDNAHEHTDLTHDGFYCSGSCEPVKQSVYWYESGVTDVANAKINFI